jgi:acetoin utilization deacetylase AcuC-like enzyme
MKIFYSEMHRQHNPPFEVVDGGKRVAYLENPERMDRVLSALRKTGWAEITEPSDSGLGPILAVHDADYVSFLATAWDEWHGAATEEEPESAKLALLPATFALRRNPHRPSSLLGRAGYYLMDLSAAIVEGTYKAALASANCAVSGAEWIADVSTNKSPSWSPTQAAFALCRPPGHHAGRDYAAGYCYINNAAVAANLLASKGKVALLDIDYHAGNGTQDIFYERPDVLTISLHGDPSSEYPYYAGYRDETGKGEGTGFHHNFPLPSGTTESIYLATLDKAVEIIQGFAPKYLVVSAGMDIFEGDPLGKFKVTQKGFQEIGNRIANLRTPTLLVMEGGYNSQALGENVVSFISSLEQISG